jgi:hypothetical protein
VLRRLAPALLVMATAVAACGGQGPALTDPKEIISQGLQATRAASSLHLDVALSGTVNIPETGGTFDLGGTTAGGDFDIANKRARLTFSIPALLDISGEAIQIGSDTYLKTTLTGAQYVKSTADQTSVPLDPSTAFDQVESFLDKEGVLSEKLDDVTCGDRTCYRVRLTIPSSLLADAGTPAGIDLGGFLGESLVIDLQFDRENLRARQVSTDVEAGEVGPFGIVITFSNYDASVEVSPPPDDQVTEEGGLPF